MFCGITLVNANLITEFIHEHDSSINVLLMDFLWENRCLAASFVVVVAIIVDLLFLLSIWIYISNYVVLSSTCNHNTDTIGRPILRITHISGNVSVQ